MEADRRYCTCRRCCFPSEACSIRHRGKKILHRSLVHSHRCLLLLRSKDREVPQNCCYSQISSVNCTKMAPWDRRVDWKGEEGIGCSSWTTGKEVHRRSRYQNREVHRTNHCWSHIHGSHREEEGDRFHHCRKMIRSCLCRGAGGHCWGGHCRGVEVLYYNYRSCWGALGCSRSCRNVHHSRKIPVHSCCRSPEGEGCCCHSPHCRGACSDWGAGGHRSNVDLDRRNSSHGHQGVDRIGQKNWVAGPLNRLNGNEREHMHW